MTDVSLFFREASNEDEELVKFAPTNRFKDANGNPIEWTLKKITTQRNREIIEASTSTNQKTGVTKLNEHKYTERLVAECVVDPNLNDATLQDDYNVRSAEDLAPQILKYAGEWGKIVNKLNEINGFKSLAEDVEDMGN